MSDPDADRLEERLLRVFRMSHTDPQADVLVQRRVALTFVFTAPDVVIRVDGRNGEAAQVTAGAAARGLPSDLTFRMSGGVAHALWTGDLNPLGAVIAGQLSLQGPLPLALALSPSLKVMQAAYRAVLAEEAGAARAPAVSTPGA